MNKKTLEKVKKYTKVLEGLGYQLSYDSFRATAGLKDIFIIKSGRVSFNRLVLAEVEAFIKKETPEPEPEPEPKEEKKS